MIENDMAYMFALVDSEYEAENIHNIKTQHLERRHYDYPPSPRAKLDTMDIAAINYFQAMLDKHLTDIAYYEYGRFC